eukprot:maker-scaffold17_size721972-snap-gene-6.24 protein:Tk09981 transcript:maker-scaffold17_size721972-snap-gene-6.24-mRNA-1 annotation:"unknown"
MSDRAIVSVHVGHYANHVGSHLWNIQEANFAYEGQSETCHDILYREGLTLNRQVTFTPRVINVDRQGALGALPQFGDLYEPLTVPKVAGLLWTGATVVQKEEPLKKNPFQLELDSLNNASEKDLCEVGTSRREAKKDYSLDEEVRTWSDYLYGRFHPKSNVLLRDYQHKNTLKPFDVFNLGLEAWKEDVGEEIEDRIRFFVEDADSVQGFHILTDDFDGFGGITAGLVDYLEDEFGNKTRLVFPTSPPAYPEYSGILGSTRLLNSMLSLSSQVEGSSALTPLTLAKDTFVLPNGHRKLPSIQYKPNLMYHSSAIVASVLDSLTLPWRANEKPTRIYDVVNGLNGYGRKICAAKAKFPFVLNPGEYLVDVLQKKQDLTSLLPGIGQESGSVNAQSLVMRGLDRSLLKPADFERNQMFVNHPFLGSKSIEEALEQYLAEQYERCPSVVHTFKTGASVSRPYPDLFDARLSNEGIYRQTPRNASDKLTSVPALVTWQSSQDCQEYLKRMCDRVAKINIHKLHRFETSGCEASVLEESMEKVLALKENYQPPSCM